MEAHAVHRDWLPSGLSVTDRHSDDPESQVWNAHPVDGVINLRTQFTLHRFCNRLSLAGPWDVAVGRRMQVDQSSNNSENSQNGVKNRMETLRENLKGTILDPGLNYRIRIRVSDNPNRVAKLHVEPTWLTVNRSRANLPANKGDWRWQQWNHIIDSFVENATESTDHVVACDVVINSLSVYW